LLAKEEFGFNAWLDPCSQFEGSDTSRISSRNDLSWHTLFRSLT